MTLTIRPAAPGDAATVLRFAKELATFEREPDAVVSTEAMMHEALFGAKPLAEALIAEVGGAAVGFALFYHTFSTWTGRKGIWLDDLYITPDARGSGAGKALLKELAGICLDRDCARFEWWVLDWNDPAIGFYRSIGAQAMDEWTTQRVDGDALVTLAGRG
ncbi:MAG: GNAT family N-acetyltransferase [Pseudomonadota bacterium]